jgi:hypothetical protein
MQRASVRIGGHDMEAEEVKQIVTGYSFATREVAFTSPNVTTELGSRPSLTTARWAYRSYDCIPASGGPLDDRDLLIAAGINGRLDSTAFLAMQAVASDVSSALARIPTVQPFWDLPSDSVGPRHPTLDTPAWYLWRAWWLMMGTADVGLALTHKVLHHKRPALVPLLDNRTVRALTGKDGAWKTIHAELNQHRSEWEDLEAWFAKEAAARSGLPLTRLRMHDIVVWCRASNELSEARQAGADLLRAGEG